MASSLESSTDTHSGRVARTVTAVFAYQGYHRKTSVSGNVDKRCCMCGKTSESVGHILGGCSAIVQSQYLARHNKAVKILFFEMLRYSQELTNTLQQVVGDRYRSVVGQMLKSVLASSASPPPPPPSFKVLRH